MLYVLLGFHQLICFRRNGRRKKDLEEDEEKAEVLLEVMDSFGRIYEEEEEWIQAKKDELEEFLSVIEELLEFLPED